MQDPDVIRRRLVEIDDALRRLPSSAFADKHALNSEADRLRAKLRILQGVELAAASDDWAERAGHKGSHSVNEDEQQAAAAIVSPGEGAGSY